MGRLLLIVWLATALMWIGVGLQVSDLADTTGLLLFIGALIIGWGAMGLVVRRLWWLKRERKG